MPRRPAHGSLNVTEGEDDIRSDVYAISDMLYPGVRAVFYDIVKSMVVDLHRDQDAGGTVSMQPVSEDWAGRQREVYSSGSMGSEAWSVYWGMILPTLDPKALHSLLRRFAVDYAVHANNAETKSNVTWEAVVPHVEHFVERVIWVMIIRLSWDDLMDRASGRSAPGALEEPLISAIRVTLGRMARPQQIKHRSNDKKSKKSKKSKHGRRSGSSSSSDSSKDSPPVEEEDMTQPYDDVSAADTQQDASASSPPGSPVTPRTPDESGSDESSGADCGDGGGGGGAIEVPSDVMFDDFE